MIRIRFKYLLLGIGLLLSLSAIKAQKYTDLIEKSYEYLDKNDLPAAEESLKAAMHLEPANPHNYALLTNLGTIQRRQGKYDDAILSYTAALSNHPDNETILSSRASLYTEMGNLEKAIIDYTSIIFYQPKNENAYYYRGLIYLQDKNFMAAENDFNKVLEINEKSVRGRVGHALLEKQRGNYDQSERIFNYLISEKPNDWSLYEGRADLYFMMGKNARAMADVQKVFTESEPTAELYVLRGKIKIAQLEKSSAAEDFTKAKELGYDSKVIDELMKMTK